MSKDLPGIPDGIDPGLKRALLAMREALQVMRAHRGDPIDAAVTWRDLIDHGFSTKTRIPLARGVKGDPGEPGPPSGVTPDLTPPPTVTSLTADAAFTHVIVEWAGIGYSQGHGNKQTIIYGVQKDPSDATEPVFGDAAVVTVAPHALTIVAIPSEPNIRWHLWAKFESNDGVLSTDPAGGLHGVVAQTGQDIAHLLEVLSGQIRESHLFTALGQEIDALRQIPRALDELAESHIRAMVTLDRVRTDMGERLTLARRSLFESVTTVDGKVVAEAKARLELGARVDTAEAAIVDEQTARADGDTAITTSVTTLAGRVTATEGSITDILDLTVSPTSVLATTITTLTGDVGDALGGVQSILDLTVSPTTVLASTLTTLAGDIGVAQGAIDDILNLDISPSSALATQITTFSTQIGTNSTAISNEVTARTDADGHMAGAYTVRIQLSAEGRTVVGGFGLTGTSSGTAGPTIDFGVRADTFWVAAPAGSSGVSDIIPFIVQTADTTINGVAVPKGVYMDTAFIRNGSISNAKIGNAVIDNAKIANVSAAKITAGAIAVGQSIYSTGYVGGSSGWTINGDGTAEFGAAMIRGQLTASQIDSRGLSIKDALGNIILSAGSPLAAANITPASSWLNANVTLSPQGLLGGAGGGQVTLSGLGQDGYRVVAKGFSGTPPTTDGLYDDAGMVQAASRSYVVSVFDRATRVWDGHTQYDVYTSAANATAMAEALDALGSNKIVVIWSYDEPKTNRLLNGLPAAIYRCGGSRAVFGSPNFKERAAYVLIGIPGMGEGNGMEFYAGDADDSATAWLDITFSLRHGNLQTATATPRTIGDYGYTGAMDATNGAPAGTLVGGTLAETIAAATAAVNHATTGLALRLRSNAQNILAGAGGLSVGTLTWDSEGNRTDGYGIGITAKGLLGYNTLGNPTFTIDGTNGNATFYGTLSGATGTFAGSLSAATGTFAGSLSAATGTFAGALSAATGTFSGTLTADAVNAVSTINIAGNAVTVPEFASASSTVFSPSSGSTTVLTSAAVNPGTGSVLVMVTADWVAGFDPGGETGASTYAAPTFTIKRDSTSIASWTPNLGGVISTRQHTSYTVKDSPGGSSVYTLEISGGVVALGTNASVGARTMLLLGVKR